MDVHNLIDLYTDYLIASPGQSSAIGMSALFDNTISHDKITRLLSSGVINSAALWKVTKPMCHEISSPDAVLIFDDSVEEKKYTDSSDLIEWHFDHTVNRSVKGVNFLTALYHSKDMSLPIGVEYVKKDRRAINKKGKLIRISSQSKNELFRKMTEQACYNINFKYVLSDTWFSSAENMNFVKQTCKRDFIFAIKANRKVALTKEDKENGLYINIKSLKLEGSVMSVYFEQLDFPVVISKQVFKNEDGSTGILYLASSDLSLAYDQVTTIYKKRWKVEEYHKSIKSNSSFAKSPTRTETTQISHFTASIMAFVKLERLKIRTNQNHFAMKNRLLLQAVKASYVELQRLSTPHSQFA